MEICPDKCASDGVVPSTGVSKDPSASYREIVKSSAIIGGSSILNILLSVVRTKLLALLLGPAGVGLMGLFNSITGMATMLAGMGISNSGVRQIAEAAGTGEEIVIARTATILRRCALVLGALGAIALFVLAKPVSIITFGNISQATAVAVLSVTVLLASTSGAQSAVVQGTRRIGDFARITVFGAFWSTLLGIPLVYWLGQDGIVPLLVTVASITAFTCWWYDRRTGIQSVKLPWSEVLIGAKTLLQMGFVFMISGVLSAVAAYVTRLIIVRRLGVEAAGYYQAAWALSGLYASFIIGAMGSDFYPRLTAISKDNEASNRLVNEQAEIGLLFAMPGILATIIFAPLVIMTFYSGAFGPAIEILRWQVLGVLLKVAALPIGFILLAKGAGKLFVLTEFLSNFVFVAGMWFCIHWFGLEGTGVAFFVLYAFAWLLVFLVVRSAFGFAWSPANRRLMMITVPVIVCGLCISRLLPLYWSIGIGSILLFGVGAFCVQRVTILMGRERLPKPLQVLQKYQGYFRWRRR